MTAEQYPPPLVPADKRFATARAAAALKGYALHTDPHGGYYVTWRGLMQCFESLEEFEEWFERVTGSVG